MLVACTCARKISSKACLDVRQVEFANENDDFDARKGNLIYNIGDLSLACLALMKRSVLQ